MKVSFVSVNGGASPVNIPATIPAKFVRIRENSGIPSEILVVKLVQPNGSLSATEASYPGGSEITIHRSDGIIARPAGYSASGVPASGETYCQIRTNSGNTITVEVVEHEELPKGNY